MIYSGHLICDTLSFHLYRFVRPIASKSLAESVDGTPRQFQRDELNTTYVRFVTRFRLPVISAVSQ